MRVADIADRNGHFPPRLNRSRISRWGSALGHEERFPSPSLSGRCRLGEATFAGMGGKEEDAPVPDFRWAAAEAWR